MLATGKSEGNISFKEEVRSSFSKIIVYLRNWQRVLDNEFGEVKWKLALRVSLVASCALAIAGVIYASVPFVLMSAGVAVLVSGIFALRYMMHPFSSQSERAAEDMRKELWKLCKV